MGYPTAENRLLARQNPTSNLGVLLRERHRFLGDYIQAGDRVLEIGAGIGITHRFLPEVNFCCTDFEAHPWTDAVASGEALPFRDESFNAVVCIAVLHHMDYPLKALKELARVLKPGGTALIMEVHTSWLLRLFLSLTGHEYVDTSVDPFGPDSCQSRGGDNWDGNNAIGDLLFSDAGRLEKEIPELFLIHHRYTESFLFINSGGVNYKAPYIPLPEPALNWIAALDRFLGRRVPDIFSICQEIVLKRQAGSTAHTPPET